MSEITKDEVAGWIRNLIPYLEKPAIISPEGFWEKNEYDMKPGKIIEYGDNLSPSVAFVMFEQTENLKALVELYKSLGENNECRKTI